MSLNEYCVSFLDKFGHQWKFYAAANSESEALKIFARSRPTIDATLDFNVDLVSGDDPTGDRENQNKAKNPDKVLDSDSR